MSAEVPDVARAGEAIDRPGGPDGWGTGTGTGPPEAANDEAGLDEPVALYPPVVAVVVTRNPGSWFDATLQSFLAQDYPDLTVLVVDCASERDLAPDVAAVLPGAFVKRLEQPVGFAAAANEALTTVEGATFLLLCHDDVVLDPPAVRVMVEEAYRSNAGIVGPKLVRADQPDVLLEVGRAIDRFGVAHTGIEPGEVDQEQHDAVHDVFYVPTAAMLVRADLFAGLGGFDPEAFPGAEDLDLCWRARLAGARVLVVPDARVLHREAAVDRARSDRAEDSTLARNRVRVLLTCYSLPTLLWLVPVGVVVGVVEAVGLWLTGRRARGRAAVSGWFSNLVHLPRLTSARARAQGLRRIHDRDLRELQVGTSARLATFFRTHVRRDERTATLVPSGWSVVDACAEWARSPAVLAFATFVLFVLLGSRRLITGGFPAIGTLVPWPSARALLDTYASAWRTTGLGAEAPAPPLLVLLSGAGTVLLGAMGAARTLLVIAALPVGMLGAYRFVRARVGLTLASVVAALAYGINPVARNAIAAGRLGPLVTFALLPFLLTSVLRIAKFPGWDRPEGPVSVPRPRGELLRLGLLCFVVGACYPLGLGVLLLGVVALLASSLLVGRLRRSVSAVRVTIVGIGLAVVLLMPWPVAYVGDADGASLGLWFRAHVTLADVLRFHTGPNGSGWGPWGLLVAAALALLVAEGARWEWAVRGWVLALAAWAAVWLPSRFAAGTPVAAPEAALTLAALGVALAAGIGSTMLVDGIHTFHFGWRQPAVVVGALAMLLPVLGFLGDVTNGRWHTPDEGWADVAAFVAPSASSGGFRMLWLGDPQVLPLDPSLLADGTGFTLTRDGSGDASALFRAPDGPAERELVGRAVTLATSGRTDRLGAVLATAGVRFVALVTTSGTGSGGVQAAAPPGLAGALANQNDLVRRFRRAGLVLYENAAWIPTQSVVPGEVPSGGDPVRSSLAADLEGATAVNASDAPSSGTVLLAEAYDSGWQASADDRRLSSHERAFGWSNAFAARDGAVRFSFSGQRLRWMVLMAEVVLWCFVGRRWWRTRTPRSRRARILEAAESRHARREREARQHELDDVDDEALWWERV